MKKQYWTNLDNKIIYYVVLPYLVIVWGYVLFLPKQYKIASIESWINGLTDFWAILLFIAPYWVWVIVKIITSILNKK
jgi:hypothetical protein